MLQFKCTGCGFLLKLKDEMAGKKGKCPECGVMLAIPSQSVPPQQAARDYAPNPAAVPSDRLTALSSAGSQRAVQPVTRLMAQYLLATRPWVLFLSIMGFIGCGLMVLAGLGMMVFGGLVGKQPAGFPLPMGAFGLICLVMAALYAAPAWLLFSYASAIKRYRHSGSSRAMEAALASQKSFWKFVGIVTIVVLAIYLVGFLIVIVAVVVKGVR